MMDGLLVMTRFSFIVSLSLTVTPTLFHSFMALNLIGLLVIGIKQEITFNAFTHSLTHLLGSFQAAPVF